MSTHYYHSIPFGAMILLIGCGSSGGGSDANTAAMISSTLTNDFGTDVSAGGDVDEGDATTSSDAIPRLSIAISADATGDVTSQANGYTCSFEEGACTFDAIAGGGEVFIAHPRSNSVLSYLKGCDADVLATSVGAPAMTGCTHLSGSGMSGNSLIGGN